MVVEFVELVLVHWQQVHLQLERGVPLLERQQYLAECREHCSSVAPPFAELVPTDQCCCCGKSQFDRGTVIFQ